MNPGPSRPRQGFSVRSSCLISTRPSSSHEQVWMTGPVALRVPHRPSNEAMQQVPSVDASYRVRDIPGLTDTRSLQLGSEGVVALSVLGAYKFVATLNGGLLPAPARFPWLNARSRNQIDPLCVALLRKRLTAGVVILLIRHPISNQPLGSSSVS